MSTGLLNSQAIPTELISIILPWRYVSPIFALNSVMGIFSDFARTYFLLPFTSFASSTLPAQWKSQDVGEVSEAGNTGVFDGIFYIEGSGKASGHVYYNDADEFHYVYTKLSGDMEIIARLLTHTYTLEWGKTGVMIRETLHDKSKYAMVGVTHTANPVLYRREKTGERSDLHSWSTRTGYNWLKLIRIGDTFTGFKSKDGRKWIELEKKVEIPMADTVYVGLAITSNVDGIISTATYEQVKVKQPPLR